MGTDGKVAIVTGAGSGIGRAVALAFLGAGYRTALAGRRRDALDETAALSRAGERALVVPTDVVQPDAVNALFTRTVQRFGRVDVLFNNAGRFARGVPLEDLALDEWKQVLDVNLTGMFLCIQAAVPLMPRGATIVNNLSAAAKQIFPKFAAYNASKHGALGLTLTLREELIPRGIRVTALMPGAADTDIWNHFWPHAPRDKMIAPESVAQAVLYAVLLPPNANLQEMMVVPVVGEL